MAIEAIFSDWELRRLYDLMTEDLIDKNYGYFLIADDKNYKQKDDILYMKLGECIKLEKEMTESGQTEIVERQMKESGNV